MDDIYQVYCNRFKSDSDAPPSEIRQAGQKLTYYRIPALRMKKNSYIYCSFGGKVTGLHLVQFGPTTRLLGCLLRLACERSASSVLGAFLELPCSSVGYSSGSRAESMTASNHPRRGHEKIASSRSSSSGRTTVSAPSRTRVRACLQSRCTPEHRSPSRPQPLWCLHHPSPRHCRGAPCGRRGRCYRR